MIQTRYAVLLLVIAIIVIIFYIRYLIRTQKKRNDILSFPRFLLSKQFKFNKYIITLIVILVTSVTVIIIADFKINLSYKHYFIAILISPAIYIVWEFYWNCYDVRKMQERADLKFSNLHILDSYKNHVRCYSDTFLDDINHKQDLGIIINSTVTNIVQDNFRKTIFIINHIKGKESQYQKLEKGSLERLENILLLLKGKPKFISSSENDVEIIFEFISTLTPKRMLRELDHIEHKLGLKKGYLSISQDIGIYKFCIKKDVTKLYLLDDYIGKTKRPANMQLPFISGMNYHTGTVITKDLIDVLHLLIAGKTGSGKSVTFKQIIESLMYWNQNCCFYMLDFAESALVRYQDFANTKYVESDFESIKQAIAELREEMKNRMTSFRLNNVENIKEYNKLYPDQQLPYLVFAIDEANGFKEELTKDEFTSIVDEMKALLKRGRKYGMVIIFAVQQTNDNDFCKSWRTQCTRLGHLLSDHIDCVNLTTNKEIAQLIPNLGRGEFYLIQEGKEVVKMKGCYTSKEHNRLYEVLKEGYCNDRIHKVSIEKAEKMG